MSISVDGVLCATVSRGLTLVNTVSSRFFGAHFSGRDPLVPFQITLSTASHGTFTTSLTFSVDPLLPVDVALGLRWKAYVQEWLLASGELVASSFDPRRFNAKLGTQKTHRGGCVQGMTRFDILGGPKFNIPDGTTLKEFHNGLEGAGVDVHVTFGVVEIA
ncbi:hypothetical protein B0H13DRAFT_1867500 [Mycena leptocephala]|nr:hypothetical protein B0H13DRAFT_1867500 [Mycena leptocephala]